MTRSASWDLLSEDTFWIRNGLCHPNNRPTWLPVQAFFASRNRRVEVDGIRMDGNRLVEEALHLCSMCPSQYACFRYACMNQITDGVWGAEEHIVANWVEATPERLDVMLGFAHLDLVPVQIAAQKEDPLS